MTYVIAVLSLIQSPADLDKSFQNWFTYDSARATKLSRIHLMVDMILDLGTVYSYYLYSKKTILVIDPNDVAEADDIGNKVVTCQF